MFRLKLKHMSNFYPIEVVGRGRLGGNYSYLFYFSTKICISQCLDTHFILNNSGRLIKQNKETQLQIGDNLNDLV